MTFPPAKRQRKLILSDDDDDEPAVKTRRALPRLSSGSKITLSDRNPINRDGTPKKPKAKSLAKVSPKSSPEKANRRATNDGKENKSLHTFFGRATEDQRWARKDKTPPAAVEDGEAGDDIEDDSLDEAFVELADCEGEQNLVLDRRKARDLTSRNGLPSGVRNGIASSQKFTKPAKPAAKVTKPDSRQDQDDGNRPWAEKFAPSSLEELAVHKKKVGDVQNWLSAVLHGRDRRVCVPQLRFGGGDLY
jgi:cell cycle checkpoint protein